MPGVLARGALTECQPGDLQIAEVHFTQLWRLEVQDRGASMVKYGPSSELHNSPLIM